MGKSVTIGAIDAGSNALRAVVARYRDGELEMLERRREAVRLGHGAFTRGELDHQTIDAAVGAFQSFRAMFDAHGVDLYRAVATSALRNAHNRDVALHRVYHEAEIELEVISGDDEARLVRKAVAHAFAGRPAPRAILDLGGGSFEVNVRRGDRWRAASLPIGTVRLVETFGLTGAIGAAEQHTIRRAVATLIDNFLPDGVDQPLSPAAACGGNAEALAELFGKRKHDLPALKRTHLAAALPTIVDDDVPGRMERFAVRRDRAEVMGVAAVVFDEAALRLGLKRLYVPGVGIRDAVLLDLAETLGNTRTPATKARGSALLTAARTFAARVGHDTSTHAEQVRRLARSLFDALQPLHDLPDDAGTLLEVAALLHDVGEVVHGRGHHKHGEYLVLAGRIRDLESPQREIVAAIVRAHRKSFPDEARHPTYAALSAEHRGWVRRLAALLRIADGLDTDHHQRVTAVRASLHADSVNLEVDLDSAPSSDGASLRRKTALFEAEHGRAIVWDVRVSPPS